MIKRVFQPLDILDEQELEQIHESSMDLLEKTGVDVLNEEAREIYQQHGARIEGERVIIPRQLVKEAVDRAPSSFTLHARNPENTVKVGGNNSVFTPGFGSPYVTDIEQGRRESTFQDYINFTKMAAVSDNIDVLGGVLVEMNDVPSAERHLKMIYTGAKYSDKVLMGSSLGKERTLESLEMISLLFGSDEIITDRTVAISIVSANSPLMYDGKMAEAIIEYARHNQAAVIASLVMSGTTGPMSIAGGLVLQNVEILAGVVLSQLVNPGAPVVYGSASTITDMKTTNLTVGCSDYTKYIGATAQLARYYGLPCRAGGVLTDSLMPDAQAGYESMMILMSSMNYGINFLFHCGGLLENYMTMSYEKFIIDDEILSMVKNCYSGLEITTDSLSKDLITKVGPGGNYIEEPHTMKYMKQLRDSRLNNRSSYNSVSELTTTAERAQRLWKSRLEDYQLPELDPAIEEAMLKMMDK